MAKVLIGCKLPHGIVLTHPKTGENVEIKGINAHASAFLISPTVIEHATTEVDAEFYETWKAAHKDFAPLTSGAIFEAKNTADLNAIAKERRQVKTGFEPLPQEGGGVKKAEL